MDTWDDPRVANRVNEDGPPSPFKSTGKEPLPTAMVTWKNRTHPVTKKKQELIQFDWQKCKTEAVVDQFEGHVHVWTLSAVKKREAMESSDKRDHAKSLFTLDREAKYRPEGKVLWEMRTPPSSTATANAIAAAEAALIVSQQAAIDTLVQDPHTEIKEEHRNILTSYCDLNQQEFNIYDECVRVFDGARCHFFFEMVGPQVRRFLNAERITSLALASPVDLKWKDYRALLFNRLPDSTKSNDILDHFLKPREDALSVSLWAAERRAERSLLETDGIVLPECTWLEFVLCFVSAHEKQVLKVPGQKDMKTFNANAGYKMKDLETAISLTDPTTFQRFRQAHCTNDLARRILLHHRLIKKDAESKKNGLTKNPGDEKTKEILANEKSRNSNQSKSFQKLSAEQIKTIDNVSNLPKKDGSLDIARYEGWKPDSLRRALWDRMQAGNCTRCGSKDHLRSKCPHKEKGWEKDFNKGSSFFDYKPPSAQSRAQWTPFGQGGHTLCVKC